LKDFFNPEIVLDIFTKSPGLQATLGNNGKTPTEITREEIDNAITRMFTDSHYTLSHYMVFPKFLSGPIRSDFAMYIHPEVQQDFESLPGFIKRRDYPTRGFEDELGCIGNMRLFVKDYVLQGFVKDYVLQGADFYQCIVFGGPKGKNYEYEMPDFLNILISKR